MRSWLNQKGGDIAHPGRVSKPEKTPYGYSDREILEGRFPQQCDLNRSVKICVLDDGVLGKGGNECIPRAWLTLALACRPGDDAGGLDAPDGFDGAM
jgi:hypothetical protein